jgi:choline dehydrogenase
MPAALTYPIGSKFYDWQYQSEPEPFMNNRGCIMPVEKLLGGSSSINGMIFIRGNPLDYEKWAKDPGMGTWDYAHCLPYFKKSENRTAGANFLRGGNGPLHLETGPATNPLFKAFFDSAKQAGYPLTEDVNGFQQEGFGKFDRNIKNGRRWSRLGCISASCFGKKKKSEVICGALATKILFSGKRATGVEFLKGNILHRVTQERLFAVEVPLIRPSSPTVRNRKS